jgi:alpha-amylase
MRRWGFVGVAAAAACGAAGGGGVHGPGFDAGPGPGDARNALDATGVRDAREARVDAETRAAAPAPPPPQGDWMQQTLYLVLPDRFANGDPANDAAGQPGCTAPADPNLFHGGDLAGLRQRIPYLSALGVTAVWATPLAAQVPLRNAACGYHGYWADFADPDEGAIEPKLGGPADVAALTRDLHAAGMRFVLDMVVNHAGRGARIASQHRDWFHDPATCAQLGDPNVTCPLNGLPDFAQENPVVAAYLGGLSRRWVERVLPDGIRMDTAKNVPASYFAQSFVPAVRSARPGLFLVAEYFDGTDANLAGVLDAGFDSAFHFALQGALVAAFARGGSVNGVADTVRGAAATLGEARAMHLVNMLDNHDLPRFMQNASQGVASTSSKAPGAPALPLPAPDELARRYTVALAALFTLPGIPQLYAGDELGMLGAYPENRRDMPAWAWDASARPGSHAGYVGDGQTTWTLVSSLAKLRASTPALWRGTTRELFRQTGLGPNVLVLLRSAPEGAALVVLGDDAAAHTLTVQLGSPSTWADGTALVDTLGAGAPERVKVTGGRVALTLPALTAAIYIQAP